MKGLTLLLFAGLMFIQRSTAADLSISATTNSDSAELRCNNGKWQKDNLEKPFNVQYTEDRNEIQTCMEDGEEPEKFTQILVRVRTCKNCIEMNIAAIAAIATGNILATILIGVAVYSLTAQPKGKSFSGNKASDKEHLIRNGDGDTYQPLAPGQKSEYQTLGGARRK
ncbi:T-cell surface glycoprotein CD3 gamma chain [Pygocentrus nattereri]|uniref:CD3 gamma/delta subunit Ig-like domain-containing protein n=1 Tax=Pygocentrus nattereri TaxID=42514 RepID=A0A3B4DGX7_PYGNA|nr:T-cell surface glycoprotein CD3 gamma chain [Pygocentrus nattereri]